MRLGLHSEVGRCVAAALHLNQHLHRRRKDLDAFGLDLREAVPLAAGRAVGVLVVEEQSLVAKVATVLDPVDHVFLDKRL